MADVTVSKVNEVFMRIDCEPSIMHEISDKFTFMTPNAKFDPRVKRGLWDGKISLVKKNNLYLGLLRNLIEFCKESNYSFESKIPYNNKKVTYEEIDQFIQSLNIPNIVARDYQINAVVKTINENNRKLILSPTSSGKSYILYILYRWYDQQTVLIVPTKSLVRQMAGDFRSYGYEGDIAELYSDSGKIVDKNNLPNILCTTWQSIAKMPAIWFNQFETVMGDECHGCAAKSLVYILESCTNASTRIGCTGTLDENNILTNTTVVGLTGQIFRTKTTEELIKDGQAAELEIEALQLIYSNEDKKQFISHMKQQRAIAVSQGKDYKGYPDETDWLINHEKRNLTIAKLAKSLKSNTLVLFRNIEHGKALQELIQSIAPEKDVRLVYGKIKTNDREELRAIMEKNNNVIGVCSYATFATGNNIKNLHNLIFAAPIKAQIKVLQAIGRVLRLHDTKAKARLFDIGDDITTSQSKNFAYKHFMVRLEYYLIEKFSFKIRKIQL